MSAIFALVIMPYVFMVTHWQPALFIFSILLTVHTYKSFRNNYKLNKETFDGSINFWILAATSADLTEYPHPYALAITACIYENDKSFHQALKEKDEKAYSMFLTVLGQKHMSLAPKLPIHEALPLDRQNLSSEEAIAIYKQEQLHYNVIYDHNNEIPDLLTMLYLYTIILNYFNTQGSELSAEEISRLLIKYDMQRFQPFIQQVTQLLIDGKEMEFLKGMYTVIEELHGYTVISKLSEIQDFLESYYITEEGSTDYITYLKGNLDTKVNYFRGIYVSYLDQLKFVDAYFKREKKKVYQSFTNKIQNRKKIFDETGVIPNSLSTKDEDEEEKEGYEDILTRYKKGA